MGCSRGFQSLCNSHANIPEADAVVTSEPGVIEICATFEPAVNLNKAGGLYGEGHIRRRLLLGRGSPLSTDSRGYRCCSRLSGRQDQESDLSRCLYRSNWPCR